ERLELPDVEIVARGYAFQAVARDEIFRRPGIRHIQREIAPLPLAPEEGEVIVVAHQVSVGVGRANLLQDPLLARFEDAGWRNPDTGSRLGNGGLWSGEGRALQLPETGNRPAVVLRVLELAVN